MEVFDKYQFPPPESHSSGLSLLINLETKKSNKRRPTRQRLSEGQSAEPGSNRQFPFVVELVAGPFHILRVQVSAAHKAAVLNPIDAQRYE